jgi:hypothetical protein
VEAGAASRERELATIYRSVAVPTSASLPTELGSRLRCFALSDDEAIATLRCYVQDHAEGLRTTLAAAAHDPLASRLLAPEVLIILMHLDLHAFELRRAWPRNCPIEPLLALADILGLPFAD